ncbi:hypothetical protein QBC46DRAFT_70027 [Diplogelasinospora grovesii]|uniref:DUF3074 domain-containing protein n=1 Tax=Diplogelasinospora grovesii TaxID=303347 RepID=A0AAN6RYQ1_9PEZI|nr:hypothetical protein QBC46DRAFT_70027 [Diplogelasinospora grovesii]
MSRMIRLAGLPATSLPPTTATPSDLAPFLISILQEAVPFISTVGQRSVSSGSGWKAKRGIKTLPGSTAPISLYERTVNMLPPRDENGNRSGGSGGGSSSSSSSSSSKETWICRRSTHEDAPQGGTASWQEFRYAFKEHHVETEDKFTPSVVGSRICRVWDCGSVEAEEANQTFGNFSLCVAEMRHAVGRPLLKDRVFCVLQMTCSVMTPPHTTTLDQDAAATSHDEQPHFIVVSIPVTDFESQADARLSKEKDVVVGGYASVERIRKLPETTGDGGGIEWIMATASDAGGVLPQWMQNMAVPGQIAKDVPLFLSWIAKERQTQDTTSAGRDGDGNGDNCRGGQRG